MCWLFVPGSAASNSELTLPQAEQLARYVTWRGKPMQPRYWQRAWRKATWLRLLSGVTSPPSTLDRGVESWISSLRASRASRTASLASSADTRTTGPSGHSSSESWPSVAPPWSSSRTSQPSLAGFENPERLYADWVTRSRSRSSSLRKTSGRRTGGSESSSWPTSGASDWKGSSKLGQRRGQLDEAAERKWPSPTAGDRCLTPITEATRNSPRLGYVAAKWPTPDANSSTYSNGERGENLREMSSKWQTPSVADTTGGHLSRSGDRSGELLLKGQAKQWPTPKTPTGGPEARAGRAARGSGGEDLGATAESWPGAGLRHPTIETVGFDAVVKDLISRRRLNPLFVEWLMGFPLGWTDSAPLGMESFLAWRRLHSES